MTQLIPDAARAGIADGSIVWTSGTFGVVIVSSDAWSPLRTDAVVADALGAGATEVGTRQTISGNSVTTDPSGNSVWTCTEVTYPDIAGGTPFDAAIVFQDNGSDASNTIIGVYGLGAQTGDGADVPLDPDPDEGLIVF